MPFCAAEESHTYIPKYDVDSATRGNNGEPTGRARHNFLHRTEHIPEWSHNNSGENLINPSCQSRFVNIFPRFPSVFPCLVV